MEIDLGWTGQHSGSLVDYGPMTGYSYPMYVYIYIDRSSIQQGASSFLVEKGGQAFAVESLSFSHCLCASDLALLVYCREL